MTTKTSADVIVVNQTTTMIWMMMILHPWWTTTMAMMMHDANWKDDHQEDGGGKKEKGDIPHMQFVLCAAINCQMVREGEVGCNCSSSLLVIIMVRLC